MAQRLLHLFTALNRLGTTVVVATHDVGLIRATPGAELIRLENGGLVDPTGSLRNPPPERG
jgi:cell division transport system ATP-binding protein